MISIGGFVIFGGQFSLTQNVILFVGGSLVVFAGNMLRIYSEHAGGHKRERTKFALLIENLPLMAGMVLILSVITYLIVDILLTLTI